MAIGDTLEQKKDAIRAKNQSQKTAAAANAVTTAAPADAANTNPGQTPAATPTESANAASIGAAASAAGDASANRIAAEAAVAGEQTRQNSASQSPGWSETWTNARQTGDTSGVDNFNYANQNKSAGYDDRGRYQTTIYGADGKTYDGYIYNGASYYANGERLADGDRVVAADGRVYTMDRSTKDNVNPNLSNALSDEFQDWLYSENAGKSAFAIKNDYEGFLPQYRTDKYGQDVSNGAVTVWPDGSVMVSDGFQNVIGRFDSAGTWHPANEGQPGAENDALFNSWESTARKALQDAGHKFTGNGLEWKAKTYATTSGNGQNTPTGAYAGVDRGGLGNSSYAGEGYGGSPYGSSPYGTGASGAPGNYGTGTPIQSSGISPDIAKLLEGLGTTGNTTNLGTTYSTNYILPNYTAEDIARWQQGGNRGDTGAGTTVNVEGIKAPEAPDLKPTLDEWRANEELRQQRSIDYATDQGVTNLQRAEEDTQQGFRTAQEQISADEMRSRDNQALYAEARGDKGGIGAAQYDSIANTAAINRQNVRDAQVKLSTDTARQIEDLRNQGEFKKADALLQISQEYLSNLMNLEQWAANYGLSAAQFEESVREWAENYKLSVANITGELNGVQTLAARNADRDYALNLMNYDLNRTNADRNYELNRTNSDRDWAMNLMNYDLNRTNADRNFGLNEANVTGYYNGRPTMAKTNADRNFDLERTNADRNFRLNEANVTGMYNGAPTYAATKQNTSNLSSIGMSMLQAGIMPSTDMLRAMGISDADAQAYLMGLQAKNESKKGGTYYYTPPIEDNEDADAKKGPTPSNYTPSPAVNSILNEALTAATYGAASAADAAATAAWREYEKNNISKEDYEYIKQYFQR